MGALRRTAPRQGRVQTAASLWALVLTAAQASQMHSQAGGPLAVREVCFNTMCIYDPLHVQQDRAGCVLHVCSTSHLCSLQHAFADMIQH